MGLELELELEVCSNASSGGFYLVLVYFVLGKLQVLTLPYLSVSLSDE